MNKYRTHNCSELSEKEIDKTVHLSGWLHRKRDHGNLLFIDLRDHYGITQCVIENKNRSFPLLEKSKTAMVVFPQANPINSSSVRCLVIIYHLFDKYVLDQVLL